MFWKDIIRLILQYLSDEGFYASRAIVHDEANVKWKEREERGVEAKRLKQAILGKCPDAIPSCSASFLRYSNFCCQRRRLG